MVAFGLGACATSHPPPTEGELLERQILEARCRAELDCAPRRWPWTLSDVDRCVEQRLPTVPWARRDSIDEGTAVIDEEALTGCLDDIAACTPAHLSDACGRVTVGLTPIGGACAEHPVCAPGSFCARPGGCGTCEPLRTLGERCRQRVECAPSPDGLPVVCDVYASWTCIAYVVRETPSEVGSACGYVITEPGRAEYAICGEGGACPLPGRVCVESTRPPRGEPVAVTEVGGACGDGERYCDADLDLTCIDDTCRPLGAREGDACGSDFLCAPGLHCVFDGASNLVCRSALGAEGERCFYDADCASRRCVLVGDPLDGGDTLCLNRVDC